MTGRLVLNHSTTAATCWLNLHQIVNWQQFRQTLATVRDQEPKSNAGRKPFDVRLRFQIQDRISCLPVLALSFDDAVPDAKTIGKKSNGTFM